jgi:hypothetical protein
VAISGGGALGSFETTVLLTVEETMEAVRNAEQLQYRHPGAWRPAVPARRVRLTHDAQQIRFN